jgi:hypothetical protein
MFEKFIDVVLEYLITVPLVDGHKLLVVSRCQLFGDDVVFGGAIELDDAKLPTLIDQRKE